MATLLCGSATQNIRLHGVDAGNEATICLHGMRAARCYTTQAQARRIAALLHQQEFEMAFADNLKQLPGISHLAALELLDGETLVARIEHKPGQIGSLTLYNHLAQFYGAITPDAAQKGLELYAEHVEDARLNPGKHPNIDRLLQLCQDGRTLRVRHVFAGSEP
jgi:hypothetical protein